MKAVKLTKLVQEMNLKNLTPEVDMEHVRITLPDINRPALQLTGYFEHFASERVQIIGYIYPDFKMYVVGGGPACFAGNRNRSTCFYMIARTDQVFGIMGVYRFQAVVMTHDDYVAITPAPTCHSDDSVES